MAKTPTAAPARRAPRRGVISGPTRVELLVRYQRETGAVPYPRSSKSWLMTQVSAAEQGRRVAVGFTLLGAAGVTAAAVGTYRRARTDGATQIGAAAQGSIAAAPGLVLSQTAFIAAGFSGHHVPLSHAVAKIANRAILPALTAWSAHRGAVEDSASAIRGAGRGVVRAIDPTGIFMARGYGERAYDRTFGAVPPPPAPSFWGNGHDQEPPKNAYVRGLEKIWPERGKSSGGSKFPTLPSLPDLFGKSSAPRAFLNGSGAETPVAPVVNHAGRAPFTRGYKDTWQDSRGRVYARKDLTVRTAAA